jgi:hypothetical protein
MTTFKFQLRLRLPHTAYIAEQAKSISLILPGGSHQITLQSRPANSLKETTLLDAIGDGFPSLETAIFYGRRIRDAMSICCALLRMGVEIGKYEEFLNGTHIKKSPSNEQAYVQPRSLDGLVVYPQDSAIEYLGVTFSSKRGPPVEKFQRVFSNSFDLCENLDSRLALAFELYNSHYFEISVRSRFLQLTSVVECLAKRKRQRSGIIDHIKNLIVSSRQQLTSIEEISADDLSYFIERLNDLKRESISSACHNLIQENLGDDDATAFKECYKVRGKLMHEGSILSEVDLLNHYSKLEDISLRLLYSIISHKKEPS